MHYEQQKHEDKQNIPLLLFHHNQSSIPCVCVIFFVPGVCFFYKTCHSTNNVITMQEIQTRSIQKKGRIEDARPQLHVHDFYVFKFKRIIKHASCHCSEHEWPRYNMVFDIYI